ncbi:MAG TPA: hypothetical protein VLF20_04085, partial [Patescibacteria group bacterium]|nr:hypothetical protein [Patescibacteria group bacterium]
MDITETSPSLPESQSLTEIPQQAAVVKKNILLTRVVPIILGVLFLFCSTTILYAYGKLPAGNKAFQESVSNTIQGLPFMPKTPQYLLEHITKAHEEKPTGKIQGTLTAYSPIFQFLLGSDEVTADVTGVIDITNPNQPLLSLTATTEQGIAADIVFRDNQIYFRITKLPALLSRVNPALADTLLHAWFTGGTYQMQKNTEGNPITTMLSDYTASDIQQIITFDSSFFNLSPEYHITLLPDNQMLSHLGINRVSSVVFDL